MRQYRIEDINNIKPEEYASFGIALMILQIHNWECRSIINGKLKFTRKVEDEIAENLPDNYYNFGEPKDLI